jgi:hypothetical protein
MGQMKCLLLVRLLLAITLFFTLTAAAYAEDGFRGLRWGTAPNELKDLIFAFEPSSRDVKAYFKKDDDMRVGDAKAKVIIYMFWKEQLSSVVIKTDDSSGILRSCKSKWGAPLIMNKYEMGWDSGDTGINLQYNPIKSESTLRIFSIAMKQAQSAAPGSTQGL